MEKATTPTLPLGNSSNGFTFMELMVVMIIIAVMSVIVYPSFKRGMESIKEQKQRANLELVFKRALVMSRFDGKARIFSLREKNGELLLDGKSLKKKVKGIEEIDIDGRKVKSFAVLPDSFYTVSLKFRDYVFAVDLYTGETERKKK